MAACRHSLGFTVTSGPNTPGHLSVIPQAQFDFQVEDFQGLNANSTEDVDFLLNQLHDSIVYNLFGKYCLVRLFYSFLQSL